MKKIFGNINMNYLKVIIFALLVALYTGIVMCIPILKDTSFQDIGITYEWWVLFAVILVINCKSGLDAMIKCFLFFLISQPLIYLVQVLFGALEMDMAIYYYKNWIIPTILTIPGGFVAYYSKKENMIGSIILGVGNAILLFMGVSFINMAIKDFPHHLLSFIFCVGAVMFLTFNIQHKKKYRIVSLFVPVLLVVGVVVFALINGLYIG